MTTMERLVEWVRWWRDAGTLDGNGGPERREDFTAHHDQDLSRAATIVARVQKERGR